MDGVIAPEQMNFADRKAFALLSAYVRAVDPDTPTTSGDLEDLHRNVVKAARSPDGPEPLDLFVQEAADRAATGALAMAGEEPPAALILAIDALRARARALNCAFCADGVICTGAPAEDDLVVASGGQCLGEIKAAAADAQTTALAVYHQALGAPLPPVDVRLATEGKTERPGMIPGDLLAANATCAYEDTSDRKVSFVKVSVAPQALDRRTLTALPYLLMHEVFCHAYQMARRPDGRPNKWLTVDPVSEGMMDVLCVEILDARAATAGEPADPAVLALRAEADAAAALHLARKSMDREPRFPEAPYVRQGALALDVIRGQFDAHGFNGREQAARLACDLNLHPWNFAERALGIGRLLRGLNQRPRDVELLELLLAYPQGGDINALVAYITQV